ncbi:MAG: prolipoprotein diacylglyceryl transferase [Gammaproteobacteria bacterium RIFCSPHIGHO2_12_FULL_35_23]|nr:MAG: prolipoprotein diacylglyceryl transferase [Gammaproteobacteria bacterium RIFCSPHIGHO2_12_FULL_35_23]
MLTFPHINSVAFQIGPLKVHWYGLMYLFSFIISWFLMKYRVKKFKYAWSNDQLIDLLFYGALGVVVGGRLGYVLFYNFGYYFANPLTIFALWDGGMSFHGGMLGVFLAVWIWALKYKVPYFMTTDFIAPIVPVGLAAGRIGNFINGELWGRVTTMPWGIIYPQAGPLPRHPSEIYEFLLEGVLLFIILWVYSAKKPPRMAVSGMFLIGYGLFRFICEFFREPDLQLGFVGLGWLTRGQELSFPMIILGLILLFLAYRKSIKRENL